MGAITARITTMALLALLVTAHVSEAAPSQRSTYVAGHPAHDAGMHLVRDVSGPAGRVTPTGYMHVRPELGSFGLTVDDAAALDGQAVPVILHQALPDGTYDVRHVCVPVRQPVRYSGFLAGQPVSILVKSASWAWVLSECGAVGTTGTITVTS